MIHVVTDSLPPDRIRVLRAWLSAPGAVLFREICHANISQLQAAVGANLIRAMDQKTHEEQDAHEEAEEALRFVHALAVMAEFDASDERLVRVTLATDAPVVVVQTQ